MPSAAQPVADLLVDLQRALGAAGLRWFLFDAQAAVLHGVARLSADVDVTVDLGGRSSRDLAGILTAGGSDLLVSDTGGFLEATRVMPFVHRGSGMPVDVELAGRPPRDLERIVRIEWW